MHTLVEVVQRRFIVLVEVGGLASTEQPLGTQAISSRQLIDGLGRKSFSANVTSFSKGYFCLRNADYS